MTLREAYELFMEWQGIMSAQTIAWYGVLGSPLIDEYFDDDCDIAWGSYDHFFSEMIRPPAELCTTPDLAKTDADLAPGREEPVILPIRTSVARD